MPKKISQSEFDVIVQVVEKFPEGASVSDLLQVINPAITRRTLQRRLETLVYSNQLNKIGDGPATRYLVVAPGSMHSFISEGGEQSYDIAQTHSVLELTAEVQKLKQKISRPLQMRKPVNYQRALLENYQANKTFYLPENIRKQFAHIGKIDTQIEDAATYLQNMSERLLIDLAWNSSRLEGNTYSLLETERLLKNNKLAEGKDANEHQMVLNHKAAIELLVSQDDYIGMNRYTVCNLHALLADNLMDNPNSYGRVRTLPVGIGQSVFTPLNDPHVLEECFDIFLHKAEQIQNPFEQAFFSMVHLPYLQVFEDVNKRTSRLVANIPLLKNNLSPLSFVDVPQDDYLKSMLCIYELNDLSYLRELFVWAYKRSCIRYTQVRQTLGEPDPFRMQYRELMQELVIVIVKEKQDQRTAIASIRNRLQYLVPQQDQSQLQGMIETELKNLRMQNIARYRVRPSEFEAWQVCWK